MKNYEIMSVARAFSAVSGDLKLPAAIAWKRRVNHHKILDACQIIEEALSEVRNKYSADEYSIQDGDDRKVKPEFMPEFAKAQADILNQDTDVDIKKIRIEDLGEIEISDKDMDTLAFMIEDGD